MDRRAGRSNSRVVLRVMALGAIASCALAAGPADDAGARAEQLLFEGRVADAVSLLGNAEETEALRQRLEEEGVGALSTGRLGLAVRILRDHRELVSAADLEKFRGRAHGLYGLALQKVGQYEAALAEYEQAAEFYRTVGIVVGQIATMLNAGTVEGESLARYDDAIATFEEARALGLAASGVPAELLGVLALNLGEAHSDAGRTEPALEELAEAGRLFRSIDHRILLARTAATESKVYLARGEAVRAEAAARDAVTAALGLGDTDTLRLARLRLGLSLSGLGRQDEALSTLESAVADLEQLRSEIGIEEMQLSFLRDKQQTYEALIAELYLAHRATPGGGFDERALAVSESSRFRSFLDHLPHDAGTDLPQQPVQLAGIRESLASETLLLQYFFGGSRVYAFSVGSDGLVFSDLGSSQAIADRLAFAGNLPGAEAEAAGLRRLLIDGPLEPLPRPGNLIVVPDGPLFHLPFARLLGDDEPLAISYMPSATVLKHARRRPDDGGPASVLAVGVSTAVTLDRDFPALERAGQEALRAASFFGVARVVTEDPDETVVRAALSEGTFDVLHFATHTWVDEDDAGSGGLILGGASQTKNEKDDGVLSVREIAQMRIDARLVVLSACTTTGSEFAPGEGVLGLGRSFLRAGVGSLVATLWEVSDDAASRLTRGFYEQAARGLPIDEALLRAQQELAHLPDVWAFVVIGDGTLVLDGLRQPVDWSRSSGIALIGAGLALLVVIWLRPKKKEVVGSP